jgi:hypothetical protein
MSDVLELRPPALPTLRSLVEVCIDGLNIERRTSTRRLQLSLDLNLNVARACDNNLRPQTTLGGE